MQKEERSYQPLIKPTLNWRVLSEEEYTSELTVSPLEPGFGVTIGNALRRVILSFIEGCAVTQIIVEGVNHEFSVLPGVVEDLSQIILAIKRLYIKNTTGKPGFLYIKKSGSGVVTAQDITGDDHLTVLNKDLKIATLAANGNFSMKLFAEVGRGYQFAAWPTGEKFFEDGRIYIDSLFSPVLRVSYNVEKTRVGEIIDYDKLVITIKTNGAILPEETVRYAASVLRSNYKFLLSEESDIDFSGVTSVANPSLGSSEVFARTGDNASGVPVDLFTKSIDELELSVRAKNCLDGADIRSVLDLVNLTEEESLKIKNFGKKTLKEVREVLHKFGLRLGMNIKTQDLKKARKDNSPININKFG